MKEPTLFVRRYNDHRIHSNWLHIPYIPGESIEHTKAFDSMSGGTYDGLMVYEGEVGITYSFRDMADAILYLLAYKKKFMS